MLERSDEVTSMARKKEKHSLQQDDKQRDQTDSPPAPSTDFHTPADQTENWRPVTHSVTAVI